MIGTKHWSQKYVGLTYVPGKFDCIDLIIKVQREVFSREIQFAQDREYCGFTGTERFRKMSAQLQENMPQYVCRTTTPKDGDGVLIKARGYFQHAGLFCEIGSDSWVLHGSHMRVGAQVVLQRIRDLPIRGFSVEGYYTWV